MYESKSICLSDAVPVWESGLCPVSVFLRVDDADAATAESLHPDTLPPAVTQPSDLRDVQEAVIIFVLQINPPFLSRMVLHTESSSDSRLLRTGPTYSALMHRAAARVGIFDSALTGYCYRHSRRLMLVFARPEAQRNLNSVALINFLRHSSLPSLG